MDSNKLRYSICTVDYEKAKEAVSKLKDADISASITPGGVAIYVSSDQVKSMNRICAQVGVAVTRGTTDKELSIIGPE